MRRPVPLSPVISTGAREELNFFAAAMICRAMVDSGGCPAAIPPAAPAVDVGPEKKVGSRLCSELRRGYLLFARAPAWSWYDTRSRRARPMQSRRWMTWLASSSWLKASASKHSRERAVRARTSMLWVLLVSRAVSPKWPPGPMRLTRNWSPPSTSIVSSASPSAMIWKRQSLSPWR